MTSLVSVVIATRDRPRLVREAIDAVFAQDLPADIEVIVVADQSTPDTSLVRSEPGRTVRVIENIRTPGLAGARNTGIEAATGEFVAFCDDDDLWLPTKLTRQVVALRETPKACLATCGIEVEYEGETHQRILDMGQVPFEELSVTGTPSCIPRRS